MLPHLLSQFPANEDLGASLPTVPVIPANALTPSLTVMQILSSHPAKTPSRGIPLPQGNRPEKRPCDRQNVSAIQSGQSGETVADTSVKSCIETNTHCVKLLFQRLMARNSDRQVAGRKVRVTILNRSTARCIPVTENLRLSAMNAQSREGRRHVTVKIQACPPRRTASDQRVCASRTNPTILHFMCPKSHPKA
jgi:hypothetical protein